MPLSQHPHTCYSPGETQPASLGSTHKLYLALNKMAYQVSMCPGKCSDRKAARKGVSRSLMPCTYPLAGCLHPTPGYVSSLPACVSGGGAWYLQRHPDSQDPGRGQQQFLLLSVAPLAIAGLSCLALGSFRTQTSKPQERSRSALGCCQHMQQQDEHDQPAKTLKVQSSVTST